MKRLIGFTLAEVLITVGIIGVVAALITPGIIENIERHRNAAILQRAYGDLQNYVYMFAAENNCTTSFADCTPKSGEFYKKFAKYLHDKQKFRTVPSSCDGKEKCYKWLRYRKSTGAPLTGFRWFCPIGSDIGGAGEGSGEYYLMSPTGLYAFHIGVFMSDNYYNIKGDHFRARIHILTDMSRTGICNLEACAPEQADRAPQLGRNLFEVYIMNSKKVLPNGTSLCGGIRDSWAYYCHPLDNSESGNCSYESGDYTACMQQVINDGWKIKYKY